MRTQEVLDRQLILGVVDTANLGSEAVREGYSGRGMYGAECFGITGSLSDLVQFFIELSQEDYGLAVELSASMSTDSMGRDTIFYFPGYKLSEEEA